MTHCVGRCCEYEPCHLWQWVTDSRRGGEGGGGGGGGGGDDQGHRENVGGCFLGLGSLDFPCFPVPVVGLLFL